VSGAVSPVLPGSGLRASGRFLAPAVDGTKDAVTPVTNNEYRLRVPTLYEATPYPDGPRYFVRYWNLARSPLTPVRYDGNHTARFGAPLQLFSSTPGPARIYGYSCRSSEPEEREIEDLLWARGKAFPSICFSKFAPRGEHGFTPAGAVVEVALETLERELHGIGVDWILQSAA
jgi:hypothetical protein